MNENESINRRGFLSISTGIIAGIIGAALGIPSVAYIIGPSLKSSEPESLTRLGSTSKVELGTPTLFKVVVERQTGWIVDSEELSVYVLTEDGRDYIAMSNICTHLGCRARWVSDQEQFYCPCHAGVFDREGYVISGPPPRPLDRYEVKVDEGQLFIGQLYVEEV
jgi:menaquinol-cytochrome c reductase iron-sulfur subunit